MLVLLLFCAVLAHTGHGLRNVSLTVSSLKSTLEGQDSYTLQQELEMNWQPGLDADWIGLFNISSPQQLTEDTEPLLCISPDDYPDGYYRTNISFIQQQYPNGWSKGSNERPTSGDTCLSYWIAAYKSDELLQDDCLKIHPTWMWDHRSELETMPLIGLFFPGTYNSNRYSRGSVLFPRKTVSHFPLTEDSDVWGELVRGIRYIDVDLGYCPDEEESSSSSEFPVYSRCTMDCALSQANYLVPVLKDIKKFLKTAKYEIVILDFHHFPVDFDGKANMHYEIISLLYSELGDHILPFNHITYNSTLEEVWHSGHNVIVAYNDSETTKEFPWLWGPIPRLCGDHQTTERLKTFLQQCMDDASATNGTTLEASMNRTAPTSSFSTLDTPTSLHDLVDMTNRNITAWFHNYWWIHANLVATDFFLGNNTTDVNIRACLDKANNIIFQVAGED